MEFGVVDAHCHIFPALAGACGFPDAETHLLHQQRAMHVHGNQPYRRARDHSIVTDRPFYKDIAAIESARRPASASRLASSRRARRNSGNGVEEATP